MLLWLQNPSWTSKFINIKPWYVITHPCPNFNGGLSAAIGVRAWVSHYIMSFMLSQKAKFMGLTWGIIWDPTLDHMCLYIWVLKHTHTKNVFHEFWDHSGYGLSQWETKVVSHWLSSHPELIPMSCIPGGYSVRKLLGVCRGPLKIGPKKIEGKMVFWGQKDRILWGFVPKRSFLCWWMRKNTPKRSSLVPRGSKKGVKTAAHMYHPSYREYPPPPPPPGLHIILNEMLMGLQGWF